MTNFVKKFPDAFMFILFAANVITPDPYPFVNEALFGVGFVFFFWLRIRGWDDPMWEGLVKKVEGSAPAKFIKAHPYASLGVLFILAMLFPDPFVKFDEGILFILYIYFSWMLYKWLKKRGKELEAAEAAAAKENTGGEGETAGQSGAATA